MYPGYNYSARGPLCGPGPIGRGGRHSSLGSIFVVLILLISFNVVIGGYSNSLSRPSGRGEVSGPAGGACLHGDTTRNNMG